MKRGVYALLSGLLFGLGLCCCTYSLLVRRRLAVFRSLCSLSRCFLGLQAGHFLGL